MFAPGKGAALAFLVALACAPALSHAAATTLIEAGRATEWRFLDDGKRAETNWAQPGFDDQIWLTGLAPLGFGEPDATTQVRYGGNSTAKAVTTYFRREFHVEDPAKFVELMLFLRVDDGAVVYLNGRDIARVYMPEGRVTPDTLATFAVGGDSEQTYHARKVPTSALAAGRNVLAIEVHQGDRASTDLFLDVRLNAYTRGESPGPEDNPRTATERSDPIKAGIAALRRREFARGIELLRGVPPEHPQFQATMLQAGRMLAETAVRPDLAVSVVQRAYAHAPDAQPVAMAWARTQLLARVNLRVPFVPRAHPTRVPEEWKWIVDGPHFADRSKRFPRAQLEADLDYLEVMIANAYSYAERRGADWRGALDAVRASLAGETPLNTFTLRLQRAFTVFGDPHSAIRATTNFFPRGYLPFLPVDHTEKRVLALRSDRSDFLDAQHPYLIALDGRPLSEWLRVSGWDVPHSSPHYRWKGTVNGLRWLNYLRGSLGLPATPEVRITLGSEEGSKTKDVTLPVAERLPRFAATSPASPSVREGIGYLRLEQMLGEQKFLDGLDAAMRSFRETHGLILDARGNRGGTQDALRTLLPYFLPPEAPIRIVNVAAYRIPVKLDHAPREGFLPEYRGLHPATASVWSEAQRAQIHDFLGRFQPNWKLDPAEFSEWHVMGIRHETNPRAYFYDRPVIVLSDAGAFSAGDNFLGALKGVPNVTILGTASGGGSGRMAGYVLPNTKLALTLCQMASFRANGALYDGAGVEPDIELQAKPTDYLTNGSDSVLDAAIARLKDKRRPKTRRRRRWSSAGVPPARLRMQARRLRYCGAAMS